MNLVKYLKAAGALAAFGVLSMAGPASAETTYNVASMADFTGPYADVMKDLIGTRKPILDWWNAEVGKKLGVKLGIKDYDHRYDAAQVASLWPGIKAELNPIITLGVGGPDVAALQGRLPADKIPMVMSTAAYGFAWKPDPWIFNQRPTYSHEAATFLEWFRQKRGGGGPVKVGIISSEASPAYVDIHKGALHFAKENPDKVRVIEVVFTEIQPTDLTTQVNRLTRNGAEVIMVMTNTAAVVATKRALQALGKNVPVLVSSHNGLLESGRAIGDLKQMEGDFESYALTAPTDEKTPGRAFFDLLQEKYGMKAKWTVTAIQGMAQALVAVRAIEAAAKKVGGDKVTGEAVRDALLTQPIPSGETFGLLGNLKFSNEAPFPTAGAVATISTIKDGKYVAAAKDVAVLTLSKW